MDPVGITIAGISLFIQILQSIDTLYQGCKTFVNFDEEFHSLQLELKMQWYRYYSSTRCVRLPSRGRPGGVLSEDDIEFIRQYLENMNVYFQECYRLVSKYTKDARHTATETGDNDPSLVAKTMNSRPTSPSDSPLEDEPSSPESRRGKFRRIWRRQPPTRTIAGSLSPTPTDSDIFGEDDYGGAAPFDSPNLRGVRQLLRANWVVSDLRTFKSQIENITTRNNSLESFLGTFMPPNPPDPALMLESHRSTNVLWPEIDGLRAALGDLHDVLKKMNPPKATPTDRFRLSVQLTLDPKLGRNDLGEHDNISDYLRGESYVIDVLSHANEGEKPAVDQGKEPDSDKRHNPEMLLFESQATLPGVPPNANNSTYPSLQSLSLPPTSKDQPRHTVEFCGTISASGSDHNAHHVFRANTNWIKSESLMKILAGANYRANMSPVQIVELAQFVTTAHLSHEYVRPSCEPMRPSNLVFYILEECPEGPAHHEQASQTDRRRVGLDADQSAPMDLRPWLDCGFGQNRAKPIPGLHRAEFSGIHNIELGLLLFQIGSGKNIDYGVGPAGLSRARRLCSDKSETREMRKRIGSAYVDAMQVLLDTPKVERQVRSRADLNQESENVKSVLSSLYALKELLDGADGFVETHAHIPGTST